MAQTETPAQRQVRLRQEALAAFYQNRTNNAHQAMNYGIGQGAPAQPAAPAAAPDQRSMLQRLLDALGGNPGGK